ncbi:MAG: nucleotidyltransferase family protein [Candidatus Bathyarchaeota archaeon]|nr:nucleotidyltransferase family protein [Candidatus Bathyarchaeum tardum]WGM89504.1 MAG: nucleotidyltransferase family protein [Candidatus Bathyarchaeum tardum]
MDKVKGIVLCGGKGTRLRPLTHYIQKTMVPVGLKQKPLLEYVVMLFKRHGIKDMVFLVNYKSEQITNYFEDGSRFGVNITYVKDDPNSKGTAGALLTAYNQGAVNKDETLLVYYGDIVTDMDLSELLDYHTSNKAWTTVALSSGFKVRVGVASLDDNSKIIGFEEKPVLKKPVSIGISVLKGQLLEVMKQLKGDNPELDFMGEVLPHLLKEEKSVYGYVSPAFWYDVLSIEAYEKLDQKLVDDLFKDILG